MYVSIRDGVITLLSVKKLSHFRATGFTYTHVKNKTIFFQRFKILVISCICFAFYPLELPRNS